MQFEPHNDDMSISHVLYISLTDALDNCMVKNFCEQMLTTIKLSSMRDDSSKLM
jgi:hypothetical protein